MSWSDLAQAVRTAQIDTFGLAANGQPLAVLQPAAGGPPVEFDGVFDTPPLLEDVFPGSTSGVSVVLFWVDIDTITPAPQRGDVVTINNVAYDVGDVRARPEGAADGGATLILRRRSSS